MKIIFKLKKSVRHILTRTLKICHIMTAHTDDNGLPSTGLKYPPDNPAEENDFSDDYYNRSQIFRSAGTEESVKEFFYDI